MDDILPPANFFPDYTGLTGDRRLDRRAQNLFVRLSQQPASNISKLSSDRAEQVGYYRLLENEKLTEGSLIEELVGRIKPLVAGRDVLCIEDSSEINVSKNKNRLRPQSGLGKSDNADNATCFKIHPGLVVDADSCWPLGFSDVKLFHRPLEQADRFQRNYKNVPIAQKESYKWIQVSNASKVTLEQAERVTFIQDREGDIYEQFACIPDDKHHLLIRSRVTRRLVDGSDLYHSMESLPAAGYYSIEIQSDKRNNKEKRIAHMSICYGKFSIARPVNLAKSGYPDHILLNCIWAQEITPGVSDPINWKLLTTHEVCCYEDAAKMVEWYSYRWYIEQVFRLLKHKGFGIEDAQLESGWALRKLILMQLSALLKILQMNIAYNQAEGGQPIEEVFTNEEVEVLTHLNRKLQGKTPKTQNNNNPRMTKWATWVVGRLGGWKGYDSQGPPGVICLKIGLDRLYHIIEGIKIAKDMCTE